MKFEKPVLMADQQKREGGTTPANPIFTTDGDKYCFAASRSGPAILAFSRLVLAQLSTTDKVGTLTARYEQHYNLG